jgi:hypothetical protein
VLVVVLPADGWMDGSAALREDPRHRRLHAPAVAGERVARRARRAGDIKVRPLHTILHEPLDKRSSGVGAATSPTHVLDVALLRKRLFVSTFPVSVPSLSWQMFGGVWGQNGKKDVSPHRVLELLGPLLPGHAPDLLRRCISLFECFPYVCPEPVLVN